MAVKTKHLNDLMKEISKELQQLQDDLMETTEMLRQRREAVEKHCWQCRDLFKPWPSKVVQLFHPDIQTDEKLDDTEETHSCTLVSDPDVEKEKQELAMLDDILAKAQHARDVQNKISKPGKKSHTAKLKHSNVSMSQVKAAKPKPKVSYPVLKRPSSAKSTYSASYTKPSTKIKTLGTGPKKTSAASKTNVTSRPELTKQPEQDKATPAVKSHETKKSAGENLSKKNISAVIQNSTSSKPTPRDREANTNITTAGTKFLISEKGSSLNMPTEFREMCKEHKKLLRRIQKVRTSTQKPSEDQFLKKVEELFCTKLHSLPTLSELEEKTCGLQNEYRELLSFVKMKGLSIHSKEEAHQGSNWSDHRESVVSKFEELNQEVQILKENLDFLSKHCPFPKHKSVVFGENLGGKLQLSFTRRKCLKTDPDGCFTYYNMKELKTFLKLSYDYQIMKLQFDLRKMAGEAILPLLRQLPTNHKSFVPLCRVVYSILCCEGKTFPTVVKDSLPED